MEVTLTPVIPPPTLETIISIGITKIGTVKTVLDSAHYKYHAILNSKHNLNIYQGFGITVDAAMRDAIERGKDIRRKELIELDLLENAIWGDDEIN